MKIQNVGNCEQEETVSLKIKVLFLKNKLRQLKGTTLSGRRVPNYFSNGPSINYREAVLRGSEFRHQLGVNNGPINLGNSNLFVGLVCQRPKIMASKIHVSVTQLMKRF